MEMEPEISLQANYDSYDPPLAVFDDANFSASDYEHHNETHSDNDPLSLANFICTIAMIVVAILGTVANLLTAYVFSRPTMTSSISVLLAGLACVDACLLITAGPIYGANALVSFWQTVPLATFVTYSTVCLNPVTNTFQTCSVWLLILISGERFVAVFRPLMARTRCTRTRARLAVAGVLAVSLAYNLVRFWEYEIVHIKVPVDSNGTIHELRLLRPWLRKNETYKHVYMHWLYFVFIFALPFLALLTFNGLVSYTIHQARKQRLLLSRRQSKEHATAVMMTLVVLVFLLCNSLGFILNALELSGVIDDAMPGVPAADRRSHSLLFFFLIDLSNLLIMSHSSFNFFVYYHFNQRFGLYVDMRIRYVKRLLERSISGRCFSSGRASCEAAADGNRAENEEAAALDEIGLELLQLQRDASSRTIVSFVRRMSGKNGRCPVGKRLPQVSFATDGADRSRVSTHGGSTTIGRPSNRSSLSPSVFDESYTFFDFEDPRRRSSNLTHVSGSQRPRE